MAKLPSRDDLGGLPGARPNAPTAPGPAGPLPSAATRVPGVPDAHLGPIARADGSAYGKAVADFGKTVADIGNVLLDQDLKQKEFDAERKFQEFKWNETQLLDQQMRSVEPGQADGFAERWAGEYQQRAKGFFAGLPEQVKPKYDLKLFDTERSLYGASAQFARGEQKRYSVNQLEDLKNKLALSDNLEEAKAGYESALKENPFLDPIEKDSVKRKHLEDMTAANAERRLAKSWQDPNEAFGLIRDLTGGGDTARLPGSGKTSDSGLDFVRRQEGFTGAAKWDKKRFSSGYGTEAKEGEIIDRPEAERRMVAKASEIDTWITKNVTAPLTQAQHDALVSFGYNLGPGALDKIKDDVNAGDMAKVAERMKTFNKAINDKTGELEEDRGLTRRRTEEADMLLGRSPSERYANLSYQRRHALITHARNALTTVVQDEAKQAIEDIGKGLPAAVDAQGRTAFDRLRMVATPNQAHKIDLAAQEAYAKSKALYGDGDRLVPLSDLDEQRGTERVNAIARERPQRYVASIWSKIVDQRRKDPAQAVSGATVAGPGGTYLGIGDNGEVVLREGDGASYKVPPAKEIRDASKLIAARVPGVSLVQNEDGSVAIVTADGAPANAGSRAWGIWFDAQRAAQTRLGISPNEQRLITKKQAQELLGLPPDPKTMAPADYVRTLKAAADRAVQTFGPDYADVVFKDAIALTLRGATPHDDAAAGIIASVVKTGTVTRAQVRSMGQLAEIDKIGRLFEEPWSPQQYDTTHPAISPLSASQMSATRTAVEAGEKASKTPTQAQIDWVKQDPQTRAPVFDQEFGRGAWSATQTQPAKKGWFGR